jgi:hypothetical protein
MRDINMEGLVVGRPRQDIHEQSAVQIYPAGIMHERHGRRFRYCHAAEAIPLPHRGSPNLAYVPWHTDNIYACKGLSVNAAAAGDKKITVTFDDYIKDTSPYNAKIEDYFQGGYAVVFNIAADNGIIGVFRISGSEISTVNADSAANEDMIIYLDEALPYALTPDADPATSVDLYPSPYRNQGAGASVGTLGRVTAIPMIAITSGYWFWGQTKGPAWVTPTAGITTANVHEVVFHTDGTVKVNTGDGLQRAGYMIMRGDGSADDSLIMLDLE